MTEVCGVCLSRGRRVTALGVARATCALRAAIEHEVDVTLLSRLAVCWECRTFVEKSVVFCERVRRAQTALRDENLAVVTDSEVNAASMSTLGQSTKVGFDFIYQFPEPEEVNCGSPETDIATTDHVAPPSSQKTDVWEVSLSPTALFPVIGLKEVKREMVVMSKMEDETESGEDTDANFDMKFKDIDGIEAKDRNIGDIDSKGNICHVEIIKNKPEAILKEDSRIIMLDLTKHAKKSKTKKIANIAPPSLTIKRINGDDIKELKVLKPSELKAILLEPSAEKKETDETMKNLTKSDVTIKKPQRQAKVRTVLMSEVEMQQNRGEERNKAKYVESLFKCETCIVGFKSEALLEDHNKIRHRPELGDYSCDVCSLRFEHPDSVAWHRKTHYTLYVCKCGYARRHLPDVNRHYAASHEPAQTHPCQKCEEVFAKPRQLRYHVEKAHYDAERCAQCGKTFTTLCAYKRHVDSVHGDRTPIPCPVCGRKYRGQLNVYLHRRVAHRATPAPPRARPRCEPCAFTFHSEASYRTHLTTNRRHVAVEDMRYKCSECDKRFAVKRNLEEHRAAMHNPHKDNACPQCDKAYGSERALREHVRRTHSAACSQRARDHVCEHCGKAFYSRRALLVHAVVHSDARPYVCSTCDASFRFYAALFTHNRIKHQTRIKKNKLTATQ